MDKEAAIDFEGFVFKGSLLDIGSANEGIIYNIYKNNTVSDKIDYVDNYEEKELMEKDVYDNAALFFFLSSLIGRKDKIQLINQIYDYLKSDGCIFIWDIDKKPRTIYKKHVKVHLPKGKDRSLIFTDYNILKDSSLENTLNILQQNFNIEEYKAWDGIYYIKAKKKGREEGNA
ncbi:hypothetical protein [Clostridium polynesiense]|uniref:hypothetical protein n=1 Tax=Clostridium polynesiense TaxID=1325933 RepID=UPI00058F43C5|nr:hypothetical protein [Clostridium polynesiense]